VTNRINDCAKVSVIVDGILFQTTAKLLRRGSLSTVLFHAFSVFEARRLESGITGLAARYRDSFLDRDVDIQISLAGV